MIPHGIRALAMALALLAGAAIAAKPELIEVPDPTYRGSDDVLATMGGRPITERDLYLYQLLSARDPLVAKDWRAWVEANDTIKLARLKFELTNLMMAQAIAAESTTPKELRTLETNKGARLLAGEIAKVAWMDDALLPAVVVHDEDVAFEYRRNWREYALPDTLRVKRLRIPLPTPATALALSDARARAKSLRERAVLQGGIDAILQEDPSLVADAGGREVTIEHGDERIDAQLQEALFALRASQVSDPIETGNAIYLYEVVSREEARVPSLEEVRGDIVADLTRRHAPLLLKYRLARSIPRSRAMDRSRMFRTLPEDVELLRVREFEFTKQEFMDTFPRLVGPPDNPRMLAIATAVRRFLVGELVTQEAEKTGGLNSALYSRGLELADVYIAAERERARQSAECDPTDAETSAALQEYRERILPKGPRLVWKFALEPRRTRGMSDAEQQTLSTVAVAQLEDYVRLAKQQFEERRAIAGPVILESPEPVIDNLPPPDDPGLKIDFDKEGPLEPQRALEEIGIDLLAFEPGEFTPVRPRNDGGAVCYYIGGILPPKVLDDEELFAAARQWLIDSAADRPVEERLREMEASGAIRFSFPVNTAPAPR